MFLFVSFQKFGFPHYPYISSSPRMLLNKIPASSDLLILTVNLVLVSLVCSPPSYMVLIPEETKISEFQKLFILPLFQVCYIFEPCPHQPVLVYTINSANVLMICNNFLWGFYCDLIPTLPPINLPRIFSHCSTYNF